MLGRPLANEQANLTVPNTIDVTGFPEPASAAGVQPYAPTYQQETGDMKTWHIANV
jgi:hypothetical protein